MASDPSEMVEVRGGKLHIRRIGEGAPVLFLHGIFGLVGEVPLFDRLGDGRELIVPDHPGYGASDDLAEIRTVSDLAFFYLDLLEASELTGVHVVGHALGGWIAASMAIRDRTRLKSLTLISPAGLRAFGEPPGDIFIWDPDELVRNSFHDPAIAEAVVTAKPRADEIEKQVRARFAAARYCWSPRLFDPGLEKWLHRAATPTLILWGEGDRILPPSYAQRWQAALPNAELALLPRCGHLPHLERPDDAAAVIQRFWADPP